jgi:DNA-binding GntR family transcriptional regulator
MTLPRLAERSLVADQVFDAIHQAIMSGDLPAGARLRIRDLAAELGTSPMPVRDAIVRLEQAGLAQRVPHKGAIVAQLTPAELVSVYDTRLLLEREATRLGSQHVTQQDGVRMREEHRRMMAAVEAGNRAEALNRDEALLTVLYAAAANVVLLELIHALWQRCRPYKLVGVGSDLGRSDPGVWSFQEPLITAATNHDAAAAVAITERSLTSATARIQALLDRDPGGAARS